MRRSELLRGIREMKFGHVYQRFEDAPARRASPQAPASAVAGHDAAPGREPARAFPTLQDRLPKELSLAGITTIEAANLWLRHTYVAQHNARFAVAAEQPGSAFVALSGVDLREVLCHEEARVVGHDNTVVLQKVRLQIPPSPLRAHDVRASVKVRRYADGSHAVFHGPRCIGRYDAAGLSVAGEPTKRAA